MTTGKTPKMGNLPATAADREVQSPSNRTETTLPLPLLQPGQPACVQRVMANGRGINSKLSAMGIMPGVRVTILNAQTGPLLLSVGESRYAMGRGMAQRILVAPCDPPRIRDEPDPYHS